jgi:hypothetical protein
MAITPAAPQVNAVQIPAVRGMKPPRLGVKASAPSRLGRYRTRVSALAGPRMGMLSNGQTA